MFEPEQEYRRSELHEKYAGQPQGGISTPKEHPFIMLFTGETGADYGYRDHWDKGVFYYAGEGRVGDMSYTRGNKAILNHAANGKDLHLFQIKGKGMVKYEGKVVCRGHHEATGPDWHGRQRKIIVFHLVPKD